MESCAASRTARFPQSFRAISPTLEPRSAAVFARPGVPERLRVVAGREPRTRDADLRSVARAARLVDEALDWRHVKALADRPTQGDPWKPADLVRRTIAAGRAFLDTASVAGRRSSARCRPRSRATTRGGAGCRAAGRGGAGNRAPRRAGARARTATRPGARGGVAAGARARCRAARLAARRS
jgi:hypothetical protein